MPTMVLATELPWVKFPTTRRQLCLLMANAANNIALNSATDLDARHDGKLLIGYLDGHVAMSAGGSSSVLLPLVLQPVNNYNWLQLPAASVTTFVGSSVASSGNGYGQPDDFRWGNHVWIPSMALTSNATIDFWGGVMFTRALPVSKVRAQFLVYCYPILAEILCARIHQRHIIL